MTTQFLGNGKPLDNATVTSPLLVEINGDGFDSVSVSVDSGDYVELTTKPFQLVVVFTPDNHRVRIRTRSKGKEVERLDAKFTVSNSAVPVTPTPAPVPQPQLPVTPTTPVQPLPTTTPNPTETSGNVINVSSAAELAKAISSAKPGDTILLADGTYKQKQQFEATAQGTKENPIVLRGSRKAILTTGETDNGGYGLHLTGSYWRLEGLTVSDSKKGIVLDGSVGTVIDGVEVHSIGQEAVHFRKHSADGVIRNSVIHDTGLRSPQFGEAIYVGTAGGGDDSNRVLIENNYVYNIAAEGIDIKEKTYDGIIRNNRFENAGYSGENSADSAIDIKGSRYLVEGNVVNGTLLDAIQVHNGGSDNVFRNNRVDGGVPGYVVGIYPHPGTHGCVVEDNNEGTGVAGIANIALTATPK